MNILDQQYLAQCGRVDAQPSSFEGLANKDALLVRLCFSSPSNRWPFFGHSVLNPSPACTPNPEAPPSG